MIDFYDRAKFSFARLDTLYSNVNSKGVFYLTINTFFIGLFLTAYNWLKNSFSITELTGFFICLFLLSCFTGIIITLLAINPYLRNGETFGKAKSIFYHGSVSDFSCSDFKNKFENINEEDLKDDICTQLHILSIGLSKKYKLLTIVGILVLSDFILLVPVIILLILNKH